MKDIAASVYIIAAPHGTYIKVSGGAAGSIGYGGIPTRESVVIEGGTAWHDGIAYASLRLPGDLDCTGHSDFEAVEVQISDFDGNIDIYRARDAIAEAISGSPRLLAALS